MYSVIVLFLIIITLFFGLFLQGRKSQVKALPKLIDGKLAKCPNQANCVCSEDERIKYFIEPIKNQKSQENTVEILKNIILKLGGHIQIEDDNYLVATFVSKFFGFVDDLEIRIDMNYSIQLRSASRVGYSDLGVNRKRVKKIKKIYYEAIKK